MATMCCSCSQLLTNKYHTKTHCVQNNLHQHKGQWQERQKFARHSVSIYSSVIKPECNMSCTSIRFIYGRRGAPPQCCSSAILWLGFQGYSPFQLCMTANRTNLLMCTVWLWRPEAEQQVAHTLRFSPKQHANTLMLWWLTEHDLRRLCHLRNKRNVSQLHHQFPSSVLAHEQDLRPCPWRRQDLPCCPDLCPTPRLGCTGTHRQFHHSPLELQPQHGSITSGGWQWLRSTPQ